LARGDTSRNVPGFHTTAWSCVLSAASQNPAAARPALAELCRAYWFPLYAYLRRRGAAHAEAEDGVQAFFARLLEDNILRYADPGRGRFRGFLLAAFRQFLAAQHAHDHAAKRRPPHGFESIETADGELRYAASLVDQVTPDLAYDYTWAMAVVNRAMDLLRDECQHCGGAERFQAFHGLLTGQSDKTSRALGEELGMSEGAVRVAVHRLKRRYAELVRAEVAATLEDGGDVEDELRQLLTALKMERPV
jgi:RNA polymerase sigma-70 factor (ECF subfamily)